MPMQEGQSSFARKYGARVGNANEEYSVKPVDTGFMRLPPGIKNGIAKLQVMVLKEQVEADKKIPKGETYFRAAAVVMSPAEHGGQKVAGLQTSQIIAMCDVPAKGMRKAETFEQGYGEMQNLIRSLGIKPCSETRATDPTGTKAEAYWLAAMKTLTDPQRPIYVSFSTRGWTPPPSPQQPKPEEMVFETWHGLADIGAHSPNDPGAGVTEVNPATQPEPFEEPPMGVVDPRSLPDRTTTTATASQVDPADIEAEIAELVEIARNDPEGSTSDGAAASARLEELAWATGWTKKDTAEAQNWETVGEMAMNGPGDQATDRNGVVAIGSKHRFARRDGRSGLKLKNADGVEFPLFEVEVVSVDANNETCTVRNVKDGKDVVDIRSKKPIAVKFEWLE